VVAKAQRAAAEAEQRGAVAAALAEQAAAARAVVTHILSLESTSGARRSLYKDAASLPDTNKRLLKVEY